MKSLVKSDKCPHVSNITGIGQAKRLEFCNIDLYVVNSLT